MGGQTSKVQRGVYRQFKLILTDQNKEFSKKELKSIVKWISKNFPDTSANEICTIRFWDSVGVKLYDLSTKRDPVALHMPPLFHINP